MHCRAICASLSFVLLSCVSIGVGTQFSAEAPNARARLSQPGKKVEEHVQRHWLIVRIHQAASGRRFPFFNIAGSKAKMVTAGARSRLAVAFTARRISDLDARLINSLVRIHVCPHVLSLLLRFFLC
jgi:hypothetical protein